MPVTGNYPVTPNRTQCRALRGENVQIEDLESCITGAQCVPDARRTIGSALGDSGKRLVVVDDDPTGTQTVHGVDVCMDWSVDSLFQALKDPKPVVFVSTNSRSLESSEAAHLNADLGRRLAQASVELGIGLLIASRSDSTLRGHYPVEVDALAAGLDIGFDGVLICPAFFEAGRYTIHDTQWVVQGDRVVSAETTEFARDPVFGYKHGNLKQWVEEKTAGIWPAARVLSVSIEDIREGGPDRISGLLSACYDGQPVIVNAACYHDLDTFVLGLIDAEGKGKRFIYRCSASFVKSRGGFEDRSLLTARELGSGSGPGLVVVGSYVDKTSRQLDALTRAGLVQGVEVSVDALLDDRNAETEVRRAAERVDRTLREGASAALFTSRSRHDSQGSEFLEVGRRIMTGLCRVVERVGVRPGFIIAKGGITSIEVARRALRVKRGYVLGQILPGVPVWRLGEEALFGGVPYVVFPGNVGDDQSLAQAVSILNGGNLA